MIARLLDWLLGPKCPRPGCDQRVRPADALNHPKDCS